MHAGAIIEDSLPGPRLADSFLYAGQAYGTYGPTREMTEDLAKFLSFPNAEALLAPALPEVIESAEKVDRATAQVHGRTVEIERSRIRLGPSTRARDPSYDLAIGQSQTKLASAKPLDQDRY